MQVRHGSFVVLLVTLLLSPFVTALCDDSTVTPGIRSCSPGPQQACYGIRPGALFHSQNWTDCTASFVFVAPEGVFMETAAHCVHEKGQKIWFYYPNASAAPTSYADLESRAPDATVAFIAPGWTQVGSGDFRRDQDFALLRLGDHVLRDVAPDVCGGRGPTGIYNETGSKQHVLYFYGHGVGFNGAMEARQGVGPTWDGGALFYATATLSDGDSGGPWLTQEGLAIGHESGGTPPAQSTNGSEVGVHIGTVIASARSAGLSLRLLLTGQTASVEYAKERPAGPTPPTTNETPSPTVSAPSSPAAPTAPANGPVSSSPRAVPSADVPAAVACAMGAALLSKRRR